MTQRKPPGVSFESWIDRQIREAAERGEFDGLPGHGKPIADVDQPYDEMWWIRRKLRRENLSYTPPSLALRKAAEDALEEAARAPSESAVRRIVGEINEKIREGNRKPLAGPPTNLVPFDVERVVRDWRDRHAGAEAELPDAVGAAADGPDAPERGRRGAERRRRRWPRWRRR